MVINEIKSKYLPIKTILKNQARKGDFIMKVITNIIVMCTVSALGFGTMGKTDINVGLDSGISYEMSTVMSRKEHTEDETIVEELIEEEHADEPEEIQRYANTYVNFRTGPNMDFEIIQTLRPNTAVACIGYEDEWTYVLYGEQYGYIKSEYLSDVELSMSELNRWGIELTQEEIELLAKIVWKEARGEQQTGREAVVEVVFNRMVSDLFGGDLYSVLSSKGQFSSWSGKDSAAPTENEYKAVKDVLHGCTYILNQDYVYFSTGKSNGRDFIQIGNHWFGRK